MPVSTKICSMSGNDANGAKLDLARDWIKEADYLLLTAGAGLTAAAGFNYADTELFAREFPGMLQYGFTAQYQLIGFDNWTPDLQWGYWAAHVSLVRFRPPKSDIYAMLRGKVGHVDPEKIFVMTSNVDALFERSGFDRQRVYTPQGDYALLQCTRPCSRNVWPWEQQVDQICAATDPVTQRLADHALIPRCPNCGGTVFINVRIDGSYVHDHFDAAAERLQQWFGNARHGQGVVVEFGAGFNTPSVIRWPGENAVQQTPNWKLLRVNTDHAEVPKELGERALGVQADAETVISAL